MKVNKPLVAFLIGQLVFSLILGTFLEIFDIKITYNSFFYLGLSIATMAHFIEENSKKIWILESKVKNQNLPEVKKVEPMMDRSFFILFSHSLIIISILYYFAIAEGLFWATTFGLSFSLMGIGNGLAHFGILAKYRVNTGCISGCFQILFGACVWISFFLNVFHF